MASKQEKKMLQANMTASVKNSPMSADLMSVINQCYQCGKCSAGCPVAPEMDLLPHQLVRLAVLGDVDR
ncbi:MAG: 4Fe-4S dicluster domain-containing protein, partial [Syntrophaceae bacterium]|nr:4Fe-4S dicluster domain-containing protein [Syntrophaceae bacterium]